MTALYRELPAGAQAACGEAYEATHHAELHRSMAPLSGSFQSKSIKGKRGTSPSWTAGPVRLT